MRITEFVISTAIMFSGAAALLLAGGCMVGTPAPGEGDDDGAFSEDDVAVPAEAPELEGDDLAVSDGTAQEDDPDLIAATGNLVANPSFESGSTVLGSPFQWVRRYANDGKSSAQWATGAGLVGKYGMRLTSGPGTKTQAAVYQFIEAVPGRKYTISASTRWRPGGQGDQQRLEVWFYGYAANGVYKLLRKHAVGTGNNTAWHRVSMKVTAPSGAEELTLFLGDISTELYGSTHDWDSVRVIAD